MQMNCPKCKVSIVISPAKSVIEWLESEITVFRIGNAGQPVSHKMQIFARLAELIAVNEGQIRVTKMGPSIPVPEHPYKRMILAPNEALELEGLHGVMVGFLLCSDDPKLNEQATNKIKNEIIRVKDTGFNPVPGMDDIATGLVQMYDKADVQQMEVLTKEIENVNKTIEKKIFLGK